ncbi:MAG TPA: hypothetical protein ENN80_03210, partial [Candidatus Hydrogenedentes bacterium]|nr:hypothetical protein [Candidatus Hydrogenedentota bacterium]
MNRMRWFLMAVLLISAAAAEENLVSNPGFEEAGDNGLPLRWGGPSSIYHRDTSVARSGEASLKYRNDDISHYALCPQGVTLEPGRIYALSAWVKTEGVVGEDSGASICLEWWDEDRGYIGGSYPKGVKGDTDWTLIEGVSARIPKEAKHFGLMCYLRKGMTGTAWWDDVALVVAREDPMRSVLVVPNYRGEVADDGPAKAVVRVVLHLTDYADLDPAGLALAWTLRPEGGEAAAHGKQTGLASTAIDLEIPVGDLPHGVYDLEVALVEPSGEVIATEHHRLRRIAAHPPRKVYVDAHNRVIVNGEPFFPLGMYWSSITADELAVYADSPFNCLMPYGRPEAEAMDLCHANDLKVLYSIKDYFHSTKYCPQSIKTEADEHEAVLEKYEAFHDHPALLGWYINDELPLSMLDRLAARQRLMEELDPQHPTWVVLYQVDQVAQYIPTFDVIGTDPYPIPSKPVGMAAEWTRKTRDAVMGARPVWQVPQVFSWANYKKTEAEKNECRPPTFDEMRSMIWQCIAEGANGIVCYSWFDIRRDKVRTFDETWPLVKRIAAEVAGVIPALLSIEETPEVACEAGDWLSWTVKQRGDTTYLIAVNADREPHEAILR